MKVAIEGLELVIRMPISDPPQPSKSGKSLIVASTEGNVTTDIKIQDKSLILGLNAYIKRDA